MHRRLVACVAVVLLVSGCGSRGAKQPSSAPRPRSTATLEIVEPADGAVVEGTTLHVKLRLDGGTIVPIASTNLKPDEGHVHLSVDGAVVSMLAGLEEDLKDQTPGTHRLL